MKAILVRAHGGYNTTTNTDFKNGDVVHVLKWKDNNHLYLKEFLGKDETYALADRSDIRIIDFNEYLKKL